jgi:hypothetical protein
MNLDVLDEDNIKHRRLLAAVATSVFISSKMKNFFITFSSRIAAFIDRVGGGNSSSTKLTK